MALLSDDQVRRYRRDGYVVAENAVAPDLLQALRGTVGGWVAEAASRRAGWGETRDGRARFDVADEASGAVLRRVNNPVEVSEPFREFAFDSSLADMVAELIGPNVKFHHSKINLKQPGSSVEVKFHQDFPYTPHSNPDLVTALVMLDDMDEENGCLMVVPGSHREGVHSLWHGGRFTGAVSDEVVHASRDRMVAITGRAGTVCLMNTMTLHGSAANRSQRPRTLFIPVYSAEDAAPLTPSPVPSEFEGRIVRGAATGRVRLEPMEFELPEIYTESSFFAVQTRKES